MENVAEIGLLKMDFLGLANLTILGEAVEIIRERRGLEIDPKHLPDDDTKTFEMLANGETFGVFQLESAGMRRYIRELRPGSVAELAAMVALYRPGPMQHIPTYCRAKHGEEPIRYPHPDLASILDETYGVIVYQDQVLLIAQKFAGYTLGEADIMRKAMGKKIAGEDGGGARALSYRRRVEGVQQGRRRDDLQFDRAVRGVRLQQSARDLLRHDLVSNRVSQGELCSRVYDRRFSAGVEPSIGHGEPSRCRGCGVRQARHSRATSRHQS